MLRGLAATPAVAVCSRQAAAALATSAVACLQDTRPAPRSDTDHADDFAKTPLRPRVVSEEARQIADLLRRRDFASLKPRQSFAANNGLPPAKQGGQIAHTSFTHSIQETKGAVGDGTAA